MQQKHKLARLAALTAVAGCVLAAPTYAGEFSGNAAVTNNYIWRGLTQTINESAVQGGLDYADDSGFYVGTWVSNVSYASDDNYSYEHDIYAGYAFDAGGVSWDVGYLYYNYDSAAKFDFGEVYVQAALGDFSVGAWFLTNTEADEFDGLEYDAFGTYYLSANYAFTVREDVEIGLHVGYHEGDFSEAFNGVDGGYFDYNISLSKGGFSFMVTDTNAGGGAAQGALDNDQVKFVVSYSVGVDL